MYLEIILSVLVVVTAVAWFIVRKNKLRRGFTKEVASMFPIILVVFVIRSFMFEPFRIPSGSMLPTLYLGDFIVVSKYSYGIRLPVINKKIIKTGEPERGDIVVFRYPDDPKVYFIKRLIGLPGDVIELREHEVLVNGKVLELEPDGQFNGTIAGSPRTVNAQQYVETIYGRQHKILHGSRDNYSSMIRENGTDSVQFSVPENQYFMMGDNRDGSSDSRAWGNVPDELLVGKAERIWFSIFDWSVRWNRIGDKLQ